MDALEDEGVGRQEEVEQAVDEGHVDGEEGDDGLGEEQAHGAREVLGDELANVDLDFLLLGVDAPVEGAAAELGGLCDQDGGRVGLLEEEQVEEERRRSP